MEWSLCSKEIDLFLYSEKKLIYLANNCFSVLSFFSGIALWHYFMRSTVVWIMVACQWYWDSQLEIMQTVCTGGAFSLGSWPDCSELSFMCLCTLHSLHYQSPALSKTDTNYTTSLLASATESVISAPASKRQADPIIIPLLIQFCMHGAL